MDDSGGGEDAFTGDGAVFFVLSLSSGEAVASDPPSSYPYELCRRRRELTVPRRCCYRRRVALHCRGFGDAKTRAPPLSAAGLLPSGLRAPTEVFRLYAAANACLLAVEKG